MSDQSHHWSEVADRYEREFVDPYRSIVDNPLLDAIARLPSRHRIAADLGCGIGPLLPTLASRFELVHAIDFAPGMLERARQRCGERANVVFHHRPLTDLAPLTGQIDVAVAVNSLVQPALADVEAVLAQVRQILRPGGVFLGILPAMDAVHYQTMLLVDRARRRGMPEDKARQNAAQHGDHPLYDFAFSSFSYLGLKQHFWHPFEIRYRFRRAGFVRIRKKRLFLDWSQFAAGAEMRKEIAPWDWLFSCRVPRSG